MTTKLRLAAVIAAVSLASPSSAEPEKAPVPGPTAPSAPRQPIAPSTPRPTSVPGLTPVGAVKGDTVPNLRSARKPAARPARPDPDMAAVLDELGALGGKSIETLSPAEARKQPTPADAVKVLVARKSGKPAAPEAVARVADIAIPVAGGATVPARVYTPRGKGPFPVILYFHGGGWVIAGIDAYDATPRALANAAGAVVVAASYRQAPEHKFPAAHEDAFAAYQWLLASAPSVGGDPARVALAGESAGGNLAINTAIRARDAGLTAPRHMLLVYPVAGKDMTTPSYLTNAHAAPLNAAMMAWFVKHVFASAEQASDPRLDLVSRTDLAGLPSATVITAEIDPLRSEGQALAARLAAAGVKVDAADYTGVSHEFFGMAPVVAKAKEAQARAAKNLKAAFRARPAKK